MNNLLRLSQAADLLQVSKETLRRWDRQGKLSAVRIGNRKDRRYSVEALQSYIRGKK